MQALLSPLFHTCEIQNGRYTTLAHLLLPIQNGLSEIKVKVIDLNRYNIFMELSIPNQGKVTKNSKFSELC